MIQYFPIVTGSLTVLGNINVSGSITTSGSITISGSITSASFASTASFVALAQSASFVANAQTASFVANAQTASYVLNAVSSSFASTASFVALAQSASNAVSAATASFANNLTVAGTLTAQTLVVQTVTSSVSFITGSTKFGSLNNNTHQFTGSVNITGSVAISSSATYALDVAGTGRFTGNVFLSTNSGNAITTLGGSPIANDGASFSLIPSNSARNWAIRVNWNVAGALEFVSSTALGGSSFSSTPSMLISSAGNVGIGTTSPISTLSVGVTSDTSSLGSTGLTIGGASTLSSGDVLMLNFTPIGASSARARAGIGCVVGSDWGKGNLTFYTRDATNSTAMSTADERMRITQDGYVLIGTSSPLGIRGSANFQVFNSTTLRSTDNYSGLPVLALYSAVDTSGGLFIEFNTSGGSRIGSITRNGASNVAYNTSSDIRLKKNIINALSSGINKINSIQVRSFDWIADDIHQDFGFIAQELINTAPEAVTKGIKEEDIWQVDNSKLIPALVKAIQELNTKFEEYKATHP